MKDQDLAHHLAAINHSLNVIDELAYEARQKIYNLQDILWKKQIDVMLEDLRCQNDR